MLFQISQSLRETCSKQQTFKLQESLCHPIMKETKIKQGIATRRKKEKKRNMGRGKEKEIKENLRKKQGGSE